VRLQLGFPRLCAILDGNSSFSAAKLENAYKSRLFDGRAQRQGNGFCIAMVNRKAFVSIATGNLSWEIVV